MYKFENNFPFLFQVQFTPFNHSVVSVLKSIPSKIYVSEIKAWSFPLEDICTVENALQSLDDVSLEIEKFSDHVVKVIGSFLLLYYFFFFIRDLFIFHLYFFQTLLTYGKSKVSMNEPNLEKHVEKTLVDALFPYQRRGIMYVVLYVFCLLQICVPTLK